MLDVFRVGVHIGMTTNSTQVLGVMLRQLGLLHGSVDKLNANMARLKWTIGGAVAAMAGFETLKGLWHLVEAGKELNKELERTRQLGGDFAASLPQTRARAIEVSRSVPTTAPSENVKVLRELGTQLQDNEAARAILPIAEKAAYVIHNFTGEAIDDIVKNLVKVADIRAQIFSVGPDGQKRVDPAKVQSEMTAAARGLILGGGYIDSARLLQMATMAGVPAKTMTQEAFYAAMVEAAVSQGASRTGTATTSLFSQMVGGTMPVHVAHEMTRMGLMSADEWHSDHGHIVMSPAVSKRFETALTDPMAWIEGPLNDLMDKKKMSDQEKIAEVFKLFGRQTTQRLVAEGLSAQPQFARARSMFHQIPSVEDQYKALQQNDLDTNITSFTQAWKGLMEVLGEQGVPVAISILHGLTDALHAMTAWVAANPDAARHLLELAAGIGALAVIGGSIVVFTAALSPFTSALRALIGVFAGVNAAAVSTSAAAIGTAASAIVGMLATLGGAPLFAALALKPSATQSGADDRAPYDGKSMAERFPNLVVPKSTPLGYVPGSDPRERPTGTADNPTHVYVQNGRDLSKSSLDYFTRLLSQPGGTTGFDLRSTPLNGPGALPSAP